MKQHLAWIGSVLFLVAVGAWAADMKNVKELSKQNAEILKRYDEKAKAEEVAKKHCKAMEKKYKVKFEDCIHEYMRGEGN